MKSNEELFRQFMVEGFQGGDVTAVDRMMTPDHTSHQFGLAGTGAAAIEKTKQAIANVREWLPDISYTFDDMVSSGDMVWARMTARGTNLGSVFGQPPTGRPIEITVIDTVRFADGKMAEHWGVPDRFALLAQLGLLDHLLRPTR